MMFCFELCVIPDNQKYTQTPKTETFDFSLYGIDLRADENDVWVPAATLCDCFMSSDSTAAVIGNELYRFGLDDTEEYNSSAVAQQALDISAPRAVDVIGYNYNEPLKFMFDKAKDWKQLKELSKTALSANANGMMLKLSNAKSEYDKLEELKQPAVDPNKIKEATTVKTV